MAALRPLVLSGNNRTRIQDADRTIVGSGIDTAAGNLTISPAGSTVVIDSGKSLQMGGAGAISYAAASSGNVDFSNSSGTFLTPTGAITLGPGAITQSGITTFTGGGTALTVNNNASIGGTLGVTGAATLSSTLAVTGASTFTGVCNANGGIDRDSAAVLNIGVTNATTVEIGRVGQTVSINGNLAVDGTETVTGGTTFTGDATFNGNVTFGDATTDTVTFTARLSGNLNALKEANHSILIDASTATSTTGGNLTIQAGAGSPASGATAAAAGGTLSSLSGVGGAAAGGAGAAAASGAATFGSGAGGAGTVTGVAGASGNVTLTSGAAGANGGAGGANTGSVTVDSGVPSGAGTAGAVNVGNTNASSVGIGRSGITTTITGRLDQLTGALNLTANAASQLTTSAGALTITAAAASTWSTSAGALTLTSAAAATWSTTAGALTINGAGGLNLQTAGANRLVVADATITVQAGVTLQTTGTGMIDLPSQFKINTSAVSANVTAANLNTLTGGGNADPLHTHAAGASLAKGSTTLHASPVNGDIVYSSANNTVAKAIATAAGTSKVVGVYEGTASTIGVGGVMTVAFVSGLGALVAGETVFLSAATAGKATNVAPTAAGQVVAEIGYVRDGSGYDNISGSTHAIYFQPKAIVVL